jgi:hypothetical protein
MSDLAPFVAAVLYDKVLAETKREVDHLSEQVDRLSEQLQKSRAVQIMSASGTVYAEGQFQDGCYSTNAPNSWETELTRQLALCPLSDLTNVQICIGGFHKADFSINGTVLGTIDGARIYMDGSGFIDFWLEGLGWLLLKVGPFPSEEAFLTQVGVDISAENMASFLAEELAVNRPELSVAFGIVLFHVNAVKGAIQNMNLDPAIEEEAQRGWAAAGYGVGDGTGDELDVEG